MAKILLEVRDNVLIASTEGVITSDTISVPCSISFSDEWAQYGKTIFFYQNPRKMHRVVVAGQSADFEVPPQAIITGGELHIGVFGNYTDGEGNPQRKVAVATSVPASKGSYNGTDLPKPSVSEYEQIISIMMAYMDAREVAEIAKKAAEQISADASAVKDYVDEASAHAAAAQTAAAASASARDESLAAINEALSARDEVVEVAEEALNEMGGYNAKVEKNSKRATNAENASTVKTPDSSVAYTKTVPANALPYAEITEIGGMTYKDGDTLRSAPVSAVESVGENLFDISTATASNGTISIDGDSIIWNYGATSGDAFAFSCWADVTPNTEYFLRWNSTSIATVYVYTDKLWGTLVATTSGKYSINVGDNKRLLFAFYSAEAKRSGSSETISNVMLNRGTTAKPYTQYFKDTLEIPEAVRPANGIPNGAYDFIEWREDGTRKGHKCVGEVVFDGSTDEGWVKYGDKQYGFFHSVLKTSSTTKCLADRFTFSSSGQSGTFFCGVSGLAFLTDFTTLDEWKAYLAEQYTNGTPFRMLYELAEPIITDISDILPADNFIQVEGGGTVTMVNEYEYDVPSTVVYRVPKVGDDYVMISSPNGTVYKLTVSDSGSISAVKT